MFATTLLLALLQTQTVPVWRLEPDLTIGDVDNPDQAFTVAFDITTRNGFVYSVHENEQRVRMWDANGKLVREIGRNGNGPGEFAGPVKAGWLADTLWIFDSRQARVSLFTPEGEFVRSLLTIGGGSDERTSSSIVGRTLLRDGTLVGRARMPGGQSSGARADMEALVRFRPGTTSLDTVATYEVRQTYVQIENGGRRLFMDQPFTDTPLPVVHAADHSVYLIHRDWPRSSNNARFRVTKISMSGDTMFDKYFHYAPRPLTDEQFNNVIDDFVEQTTTSSGPHRAFMTDRAQARRAFLKAVIRPQFHAPITAAHSSEDGSLWLQREEDGKTRLWHVMDANGRFVAAVRGPREGRVLHVAADEVWMAQAGEMDVPLMVRYRIRR